MDEKRWTPFSVYTGRFIKTKYSPPALQYSISGADSVDSNVKVTQPKSERSLIGSDFKCNIIILQVSRCLHVYNLFGAKMTKFSEYPLRGVF